MEDGSRENAGEQLFTPEKRLPQIERAVEFAQALLGFQPDVDVIHVWTSEKSIRDSRASSSLKRRESFLFGVVDIPNNFENEREKWRTIGHEIGHVLFATAAEPLGGENLEMVGVKEGVCDLVGLEVADKMLGENEKRGQVTKEASRYRGLVAQNRSLIEDKIKSREAIVTVSQESPLHILGRYFVYCIADNFPDISIADLWSFLEKTQVLFEDMFDPEAFIKAHRAEIVNGSEIILSVLKQVQVVQGMVFPSIFSKLRPGFPDDTRPRRLI